MYKYRPTYSSNSKIFIFSQKFPRNKKHKLRESTLPHDHGVQCNLIEVWGNLKPFIGRRYTRKDEAARSCLLLSPMPCRI